MLDIHTNYYAQEFGKVTDSSSVSSGAQWVNMKAQWLMMDMKPKILRGNWFWSDNLETPWVMFTPSKAQTKILRFGDEETLNEGGVIMTSTERYTKRGGT